MKRSLFTAVFWVVVLGVTLTFIGGNLSRGDLNQDEGWYLYAARLVSEGQLPYIDFASTQAPVLPFVYALGQPLVKAWGLAGGRALTALLGLLGLFSAAGLAAWLVPPKRRMPVAALAVCLIGVNVYQCYFSTIVKTYSLAGLWMVLAFVPLVAVVRLRRAWPALVAGVFLSLAAGTRVSAGVGIGTVFLALRVAGVISRRIGKEKDGDEPPVPWTSASWLFLVGAMAMSAAIFLPFAIRCPEGLAFAIYEYHAGRAVSGGLLTTLIYKAGFISRVTNAYFAAMALLLFVLLGRLAGGKATAAGRRSPDPAQPVRVAVWLTVIGVSLLHFVAPFPYDDYQVMIFPLFAVGLATAIGRAGGLWGGDPVAGPDAEAAGLSPAREMATLTIVFLLCAASAGSSPILQDWFVGRRDRIWWPLKKETPLANLQHTARLIKAEYQPGAGDLLLTQDPYLAVEAGLRVPAGLELGPFSYFPEWSTEKAAARRVVNREMMLNLLDTSEAPVAAFSGYGLAIQCPGVERLAPEDERALWQVVERRYRPLVSVDDFGQAYTTLRIFKRRE